MKICQMRIEYTLPRSQMPAGRTVFDESTHIAARHRNPRAPSAIDSNRYTREAPTRHNTDDPDKMAALPPTMARAAPMKCQPGPLPTSGVVCTAPTRKFPTAVNARKAEEQHRLTGRNIHDNEHRSGEKRDALQEKRAVHQDGQR